MEILRSHILKEVICIRGRRRDEKEAAAALGELARSKGQRLDDLQENMFDEHLLLRPQIMDCAHEILNEIAHKRQAGASNPLQPVKRLFSLDNCARQICQYAFGVGNFRMLEWYLEDQLPLWTLPIIDFLQPCWASIAASCANR